VAVIGGGTAAAVSARSGAELTQIKLGIYPSLDYAPLYVGLKRGIFKKHGLDIKITYIYTGSGLFAGIVSGAVDAATNSPAAGANAIAQGLPIKMVSLADYQTTKGNTEVLVKKDSSIQNFAALAGKTVATVNLQGLFHLGVAYAVEKAGKDPNSIKALAMAPIDEANALSAGRIDAAVMQDPFLSQAKATGQFRSLGNPFSTFPFRVPVGAFWASKSTIEGKAGLLRTFVAAWKEAVAMAVAQSKLTRQVIPKYTGITGNVLKMITVPDYTTKVAAKDLGPMLATMKKYGWLKIVPSYGEIVWDGK
jgi:NitT/TauT family transport system substrate-binding protein